ncbi:MAG: HAMP domain-containing histidine kinase [Chloroflexi bacterium]|nr:HAMP domain-containing histidine kinase [Chloroflexota bacterium]
MIGFQTLRAKLVAGFTLVIFLCLLLAGTGFIYLVRQYQTRMAIQRLSDLAWPLTLQVRTWERWGVPPGQMEAMLREQAGNLNLRIFVVDPARRVLVDTQSDLTGQQLEWPEDALPSDHARAVWGTYDTGDQRGIFYIVGPPRAVSSTAERVVGRLSQNTVVLAVPERSVTSAWLELGPSLSAAGLVSLLISTAVALLLSRSISRPVVQMTRAAEAMAKGNYEQAIPAAGRDEIGRLAATFNAMARQVNQSHKTLRDFLFNVSHELRTPLTSIQGFSQAMVDGSLTTPDAYAEAGGVVHQEAERMRRLVEDLLYLSKVESGQVTLDPQQVDLGALLQGSLKRWRPRATERGTTLVADFGDLPAILGDAHRLTQVLDNLLDNAVKFAAAGAAVTLSARAAGDAVTVAVHNPGPPIPAEALPRIFDRFYQVQPGRGGNGLGLAIVREIIAAHGGSVAAESDAASGTTILVHLPGQLATAAGGDRTVARFTAASPPRPGRWWRIRRTTA